MHVKKNLMLWVAVFALALPLLLTGTANAKYMSDGATPNGTTGGWNAPTDGICVISIDASGNMVTDDTIKTARDCQARLVDVIANTSGAALSAVCVAAGNTAGLNYAAPSSNTCVAIDGSGFITGSISMVNLDRAAQMCIAKGGQMANATVGGVITVATKAVANGTSAKCLAYGWNYRGQDATGTPGTMGATGMAEGSAGFCSAYMDTGLGLAACPTVAGDSTGGTKTATSIDAFGYLIHGTLCDYQFGINGTLDQNNSRGTWSAYKSLAGTTQTGVKNLSGLTQGQCLAAGYNWNSWIAKPSTIAAKDGITLAAIFDLTRQAPNADEGCLHCHSTTSQANGPAERQKDSFLKTGHKNMLRKVTAGQKMAGPDGIMYDTLGSAYGMGYSTITVTNALGTGTSQQQITTGGSLNFGTTGNNDATANGKPLLYIFGDWMAAAPGGLDVVVNMSGAAKYNGGSDYSCAACHTEGWSNTTSTAGLCSKSSFTTNLNCTSGGGIWTPLTGIQAIGTPGYAAKNPGDSFPGITFGSAGQWDNDGISCARCHNATVPSVTAAQIAASAFPATAPTAGGMGALSAGLFRNNLCFGCHQSMAKTSNGIGADVDLSKPTALIVKNTATAPAYTPGFSGHVLGNSFLNSPHARFTGAVAPNALGKYDLVGSLTSTVITAAANYNSTFKGYGCWQSTTNANPAMTKADGTEIKTKAECDALWACSRPGYATSAACTAAGNTWASTWRADTGSVTDVNGTQGTCATCHNVHNSLFVEGQEGLRKECASCHENSVYAADVPGTFQADVINHPTTAGTPAGINPADPCVVCHMPKPTSADFPMHVWRINSDVNYSTFPTSTEFGIGATATKKNANTATDSKGYANAVWVDVDLACGQCHGGSAGTSGTKHGAMYKTKAQLAAQATWMHAGSDCKTPTAASTITPVGTVVTLADTSTNATSVSINWGDGNSAVMSAGSTTVHSYSTRVATYTIKQTATGNCDSFNTKIVKQLVAPVKTSVAVTVTGTGTNVTLALKKQNTASGKMGTVAVHKNINGTDTFSIADGTYSVNCKGGTTGLFTVPAIAAVSVTCN